MNITSNIIKALAESVKYPYTSYLSTELDFTHDDDIKLLKKYPAKTALEKWLKDKDITFISIDDDIRHTMDCGEIDDIDDSLEIRYFIGDSDDEKFMTIEDVRKEDAKVADELIAFIIDLIEMKSED